MYQIARKIRYVLRGLAFLAAGVALGVIAFAVAVQFLADGEMVRRSFVRSVSEWSGGPVVITGPLRIASFTTLSVEASGVRLAATPQLAPIARADAQSITAIAKLSSLLRGKLEFKKVVIASPRFVLRRDALAPSSHYGLQRAGMALSLAGRSLFSDIEINNPVFLIAEGARKPFKRAEFERVRMSKVPETGLLSLYVKCKDFEALFHGEAEASGKTAVGSLRLAASLQSPAAETMLASLAPWERDESIALAGDVNWSEGHASLDNATIAFGDHNAKGSVALDVTPSRELLVGTLAYDTLDLTPAWKAGGQEQAVEGSLAALPFARRAKGHPFDLDVRISADRFRAGSFETGPLALALTARRNHVSVDIAEMTLFGGNATGRLDINPSRPVALALNGSGSRLDPVALASALQLPFTVSGPVNVHVALTMPLTGKQPSQDVEAAAGTFDVRFPSGGSLEGEMSRLLSSALARQDVDWGVGGTSSLPFSTASVDGTLQPGNVELKVEGESGEQKIEGTLRIALPVATVSGTLSANRNASGDGMSEATSEAGHSGGTRLVLSGTAEAPIFSAPGKPSLAN